MMEPLLETISLDSEESNELAFKIKVEGAAPAPAKVRLVCESPDVSYLFNGAGTSEDGIVQFIIPRMSNKLAEGIYQARVEVLIENRYFSPITFQIEFKKALKVVAESMKVMPVLVKKEVTVTAQPITIVKPQQKTDAQPIVVEQKKQPIVKQPSTVVTQKSTQSLREKFEKRNVSQVNEDKGQEIEVDDATLRKIARMFINKR